MTEISNEAVRLAQLATDRAREFMEWIDNRGDLVLSEQVRQACEAAWDAGWFQSRVDGDSDNPFAASS